MKTYLSIAGILLCLALAPGAFAQYVQPDISTLYQPNVNLTTLTPNPFTGIVGGIFYTPYYYNVNVNYVGYADPTGAALTTNHTVTIWDFSGNVVASAAVPSGTPSHLANGYAWVPIPEVTLTYQHYYYVGATVVGGVDLWGNNIQNTATDPGNNGQITWNAVNGSWSGDPNSPFVQAGGGWEYTRDGIYDNNTSDAGNPNPSLNRANGTDDIYPAPNLGFNVVPEPGMLSLSLVGMGMGVLFVIRRNRRN
jgi:hypothetical protein